MCAVLSSLRTFSSHFSLVAFPLLAGYFLVVNHVGSSPVFVCFPSRGSWNSPAQHWHVQLRQTQPARADGDHALRDARGGGWHQCEARVCHQFQTCGGSKGNNRLVHDDHRFLDACGRGVHGADRDEQVLSQKAGGKWKASRENLGAGTRTTN